MVGVRGVRAAVRGNLQVQQRLEERMGFPYLVTGADIYSIFQEFKDFVNISRPGRSKETGATEHKHVLSFNIRFLSVLVVFPHRWCLKVDTKLQESVDLLAYV
uniref:Uncharacterized protein n=1 Tax=Scophthalmus maximus TaxID=52904 RepID=A0A8D3CLR6_SCOMX